MRRGICAFDVQGHSWLARGAGAKRWTGYSGKAERVAAARTFTQDEQGKEGKGEEERGMVASVARER